MIKPKEWISVAWLVVCGFFFPNKNFVWFEINKSSINNNIKNKVTSIYSIRWEKVVQTLGPLFLVLLTHMCVQCLKNHLLEKLPSQQQEE